MNRLPRNKAFTLIELLIVITIIGILAAALLPRITSGPAKARDAQRKADLQQIMTALEFYADDNQGSYPTELASECLPTADISQYLTTIPDDPQAGGTTNECTSGYSYKTLTPGFMLIAALESDTSTGEGHYDGDAASFVPASGTNIATNLATFTECTGTVCNGGDIYYVVGR